MSNVKATEQGVEVPVQNTDAAAVTDPDDSLFSSPSALSDITLVVDGRNLHVSKCVLSLASPAFLKMFEGDFKDKTEIPLADKKYEDMVELLLCIYPSTCNIVTEDNLHAVLPLADKYGIESLKVRCEAFVLNLFQLKEEKYNDPPNKELVHFLYLADKYKLKKLLDACVEKVKFRTYDGENGIGSLSEFNLMSVDTKFRVVSERMRSLEKPVLELTESMSADLASNIESVVLKKPGCSDCRNPIGYSWDHSNDVNCNKGITESVTNLLTKICNIGHMFSLKNKHFEEKDIPTI